MVECTPDQRGKSSLDFLDDSKGDAERHPSLVAGNDDRSLSAECGNKALQLELQWLPVRRVELDTVNECEDVGWRRTDRERVDVGAKPEEIARSRGEVERR
jgi:hypothetical protein